MSRARFWPTLWSLFLWLWYFSSLIFGDHEQEFNHHYPLLIVPCTHLYLSRIFCVVFLPGTVIELDRLHIFVEQCPFLLLTFSMGPQRLPSGWHSFQDQVWNILVWVNCKTVHRLCYFRACPFYNKPWSGWSPWTQFLPVFHQDQDQGLTVLNQCVMDHSFCDSHQFVAGSSADL